MNKNKLFIRILVSPAILLLLLTTYSYAMARHFIGFIRWGGEFITLNETDKPIINDIFKELKEQRKNNKPNYWETI